MNGPKLGRRGLPLLAAGLAGCAQIPVLPDGPEDPLERHALLQEALDGAPLTEGNRVTLLDGGAATFADLFRTIAAARDHVHLEFYILEDVRVPGTTAPSLFELLAAKLRQGVAVTVIHDDYGSQATPAAAWQALRAAGAQTIAFNPLDPLRARQGWLPNARDHRKMLVVDGRVAVMGGVNLDDVYENPCGGAPGRSVEDTEAACWRDASIRIEGPAVATLQRLFLDTWSRQGGAALPPRDWFPALPPQGPARVRILGSAPGERRPRYYVALMTALEAARSRIWLATGYFVPTWQQRRTLRRAARRGVQVRLLLPRASDSAAALDAQRAAYDDMLEAGVQIHEVQDSVLHAKLAVVDGAWSAIGSSNLDRRSVAWNNEVDAIVLGRDTASAVERMLEREFARAALVDLATWRQRGIGTRLRELSSRVVIDLL